MHNEDYLLLKSSNDLLIEKRGYPFELPKQDSPIILLLSGGLDSICLMYLLITQYKYHIYPLYFYTDKVKQGQLQAIECFDKFFSQKFNTNYHSIKRFKLYELFKFSDEDAQSAIWKDPQLIGQNYFSDGIEHNVYIHNRPTRIGYYALGAYEYSLFLKYKKGITVSTALCGINSDDTRMRTSNLSVLRTLNLSMCSLIGDYSFQFSAPIEENLQFCFTKAELVKIGINSNMPLEKTWSCIKHTPRHCGNCSGCIERKKVFSKLLITDKTKYMEKKKSMIRGIGGFIKKTFLKTDEKTEGVSLGRSTIKVSFTSSYQVAPHSFHEHLEHGIFVYIPSTNLYCNFVTAEDRILFHYLSNHTNIIPKEIEDTAIVKKNKIGSKNIREFLLLCVKSGLIFKIK